MHVDIGIDMAGDEILFLFECPAHIFQIQTKGTNTPVTKFQIFGARAFSLSLSRDSLLTILLI